MIVLKISSLRSFLRFLGDCGGHFAELGYREYHRQPYGPVNWAAYSRYYAVAEAFYGLQGALSAYFDGKNFVHQNGRFEIKY